jgi:CHAD domain-containing protein
MRVAARRLRAVLGGYRRLFDRPRTDPIRLDLAWVIDVLGAARDLDVLRARLGDVDVGAGRAGVMLADEHRRAHRDAVETLRSDRYLHLLDALDALAEEPPFRQRAWRPARQELARCLQSEVGRLARAVAHADAARDADERGARLHEVRKTARRLRYAAEAATRVFGEPAAAYASDLALLQQALGDHHDALLARATVRRLSRGTRSPALVATLAELDRAAKDAELRSRLGLAAVLGGTATRWVTG